jgi:polyphosphate kinase
MANMKWARKLEDAGVHVVYGLLGLKTHAKLSLVVREEPSGIRRYCHVGTGNYNPKTARFYDDFGLLSADFSLCDDLTKLFNQLSGFCWRHFRDPSPAVCNGSWHNCGVNLQLPSLWTDIQS